MKIKISDFTRISSFSDVIVRCNKETSIGIEEGYNINIKEGETRIAIIREEPGFGYTLRIICIDRKVLIGYFTAEKFMLHKNFSLVGFVQ